MAYRSPARWLAPLALLGSLAAILIVISSSDGGSSSPDTSSTAGITGSETTTTSTTGTTTTAPVDPDTPRFYEVKPGDTLTAIADATGVPLEQLEQLNDDIDSQSLTVGERIRLRP